MYVGMKRLIKKKPKVVNSWDQQPEKEVKIDPEDDFYIGDSMKNEALYISRKQLKNQLERS